MLKCILIYCPVLKVKGVKLHKFFLQRYIWWKKSIDVWTKDHPFPIDIDYMISDTLELLRPKMGLSCSLEEATKQVTDLEREVLVKLGKNESICPYENEWQAGMWVIV